MGHGERYRILERWGIFLDDGNRMHIGSIVQESYWDESQWLGWMVMDNVLDDRMGKSTSGCVGSERFNGQ